MTQVFGEGYLYILSFSLTLLLAIMKLVPAFHKNQLSLLC